MCPDLETLAEFAEDRLPASQRATVQRHLAECAACRAVVTETAAYLAHESDATGGSDAGLRQPRRTMFKVVGVVGLAAALFFAVRLRESPAPSVPAAVTRAAALADALQVAMAAQGSRPFEPRVTGGFEYRPVETTRGASGWRPGPEVAIATASVAKELATDDSSAARRLRATAALLAGDTDGAIHELENVTGGPGEDAEVLADLSAAYYVRGSLRRDHADFVRALAFASRSTEQRPELPEAWFNRALAAEAAGVAADATASWTRYLALDPASQWSDEARRHLRASGG